MKKTFVPKRRQVLFALFFLPALAALSQDSTILVNPAAYVEVLYSRQLSRRVLQSTSTVYTNQLTTTPGAQFMQALAGRVPGLNITFKSGGPGLDNNPGAGGNSGAALDNSLFSFNIRGARAQLILIDGVERGYTSLDPEQIESITVLKDALSTVMYGQRSSYGIISVKTKRGDLGKPRLSFTAQSGFEMPVALPKPLPAWQYASLYNEAKQNDAGTTPVTPTYTDAAIDAYKNHTDQYAYPDVNWYDAVLKDRAATSRYNFNVQGSGKGFRYFVDLDYLKENGLFKTIDSNAYNTNSQLDRYLLRSNVGVDVTKTTFMQLNLFGRFQRYNQPGGGVGGMLSDMLNFPSNVFPVLNPNGSFGGSSLFGQNRNPYGQAIARGYQFQDVKDMAVDLQATQKLDVLIPGLYLRGQGSYNSTTYFTSTRAKNFEAYQYVNGAYTKFGAPAEQTIGGGANDRYRITYLEGAVGYDKTIGKHAVNVLALASQQSKLMYSTTNLPENYTSYAGRISYSYDDKYLAEVAGSYGGYNWLSPSKRWAPYWAAGIGWNMHEEKFIKEKLTFISNLKLRGNYGITGQANAGYFTYIQTYFTNLTNTNNGVAYHWGAGSALERGVGENAISNPSLGPEKAKKLDIGMDLGLWNNRLTFTGDFFYNKFYDLVATPVSTTAILGAGYPLQNYQQFNYWGTDLALTWQDKIKDFSYYISANFSLVQSKVVYNAELPKDYAYQVGTGKQVGLQYGYIATGLFKSYDEINDPATAVLAAAPKSSLRPGDIRYLDRNGDKVIDDKDYGVIGSGKPAMYYGLTLGFSIKGFDFSALVQGTFNRQNIINGDFMNGFGSNGAYTAYEYNLGRFTPATAATATQPRVWLGSNTNNQQLSSFWLKDNDFIRLKNVEIGYTVPEKLSRKIGIPAIRVFSNGLNLLTFADVYKMRKDMDPEAWGAAYPIMKVINFGINVKF
jgi:TonB-linked SusC/RagA family outer membrane protein